jgi:hypothetical protein
MVRSETPYRKNEQLRFGDRKFGVPAIQTDSYVGKSIDNRFVEVSKPWEMDSKFSRELAQLVCSTQSAAHR